MSLHTCKKGATTYTPSFNEFCFECVPGRSGSKCQYRCATNCKECSKTNSAKCLKCFTGDPLPDGTCVGSGPSTSLSTNAIIGISVGGGLVLIGIIAFLVWFFIFHKPARF